MKSHKLSRNVKKLKETSLSFILDYLFQKSFRSEVTDNYNVPGSWHGKYLIFLFFLLALGSNVFFTYC
jgi:hypothetical protein